MIGQLTMNEKYVIIGKNASGEIRYLAYDRGSGGYPYWSSDFTPKIFDSLEKAEEALSDDINWLQKYTSSFKPVEVRLTKIVLETIDEKYRILI